MPAPEHGSGDRQVDQKRQHQEPLAPPTSDICGMLKLSHVIDLGFVIDQHLPDDDDDDDDNEDKTSEQIRYDWDEDAVPMAKNLVQTTLPELSSGWGLTVVMCFVGAWTCAVGLLLNALRHTIALNESRTV